MYRDHYYTFLQLPFTSNASRNVWRKNNDFNLLRPFKKLALKQVWKAGRGTTGKIILRTRASRLINIRTFTINRDFRYNKPLFIGSFRLIPYQNKMISLAFFANGAVSYLITTTMHQYFQIRYWNQFRKIKRFVLSPLSLPIIFIAKLSIICLIEIVPGRGGQYCCANGTGARIFHIDNFSHLALLDLPSKVRKLFSTHSCAALGKIEGLENRKYYNTKFGYWRSFGFKPQVRGVAMNPVDHPHGGRTKSIRYPRTPWGLTTKYK